jgi:hypothetical protein
LANEELISKKQELSTTLEQYASATASRKPAFSLNYNSERNNLDSLSSVKSRRRGRKAHVGKPALAHYVYWQGLSLDKVCEIIHFYTQVPTKKSQADKLLHQLLYDWEREYSEFAIAVASILYIDETGWKVGSKSCYTRVFGTPVSVYYRCGVGRGKDVLHDILGGHFSSIGVTDDYACYDSIFTQHQLCWAHFLRKAAELMLRNPTNRSYRQFYVRLLLLYRQAKRYQ